MADLTEHFSWHEATHSDTADEHDIDNEPSGAVRHELVQTFHLAERIRAVLDCPMTVTSGYRAPAVDVLLGGKTGQHPLGRAFDFIPVGMDILDAARLIMAAACWQDVDQLIVEEAGGARWLHVSQPGDVADPRKMAVHWDGTSYTAFA